MGSIERLIELIQDMDDQELEILIKFAEILKEGSDEEKRLLLDLEGTKEYVDWTLVRWKDKNEK